MKRLARVFFAGAIAFACAIAAETEARAIDPKTADQNVADARREGHYTFCSNPRRPLRGAVRICPLADEIPDCDGLKRACDDELAPRPPPPEPPHWSFPDISRILQLLAWIALAAALVALMIPLVRWLRSRKKDAAIADAVPIAAKVDAATPEEEAVLAVTDAERLLRIAEERARSGAYALALFAYTNAALRALDQRGAIRIARDRTNGEYVRSCADANAKTSLREIVREVDVVHFGGAAATPEQVQRVGARATALVRMAPMALLVLTVATAALGCAGGAPKGSDTTGDALVFDVLGRQGFDIKRLEVPLVRLAPPPIGHDEDGGHDDTAHAAPADGAKGAPYGTEAAVIVNLATTELTKEAVASMVSWTKHGGALVLLGGVSEWPPELLDAKPAIGTTRDVVVRAWGGVSPPAAADDDDDEKSDEKSDDKSDEKSDDEAASADEKQATPRATPIAPAALYRARTASKMRIEATPARATEIGHLEGEHGGPWAVHAAVGAGQVVGVAVDDLFTNAGIARPGNAAALVALLEGLHRSALRVARPEDGQLPPSSPFDSMERAGLGLGMWHALAAALVLFVAVGTRLARPRPTPAPRRRAFTEHVAATGALYAKARVAPHALATYARYADVVVRAKMPRGSTDIAAFIAARAGADPLAVAALWARATATHPDQPPRGDEIAVLKQLSTLVSAAVRAD